MGRSGGASDCAAGTRAQQAVVLRAIHCAIDRARIVLSDVLRISGAALLVTALAACERGAPDPDTLARGRELYVQHCAACHGAQLQGQPNWRERLSNGRLPAPPHDESGHTWHHPDSILFAITKFGMVPPYAPVGYESDMPAFADKLSDAEIRAVLAYIASHWTSLHVLNARAEMLRNARR